MRNIVKTSLQNIMIQKRHSLYKARVAEQTVPYDVWVQQLIDKQAKAAKETLLENNIENIADKSVLEKNSYEIDDAVGIIEYATFSDCNKALSVVEQCQAEYLLLCKTASHLVQDADKMVAAAVQKKGTPDLGSGVLKQADMKELADTIDLGSCDETGYLKPGWSPDLLTSFFYFSNVFVVKKELALDVLKEILENSINIGSVTNVGNGANAGSDTNVGSDIYDSEIICKNNADQKNLVDTDLLWKRNLYAFTLKCAEKAKIVSHLGLILYHTEADAVDWGFEPEFDYIKKQYSSIGITGIDSKQNVLSDKTVIGNRQNVSTSETTIGNKQLASTDEITKENKQEKLVSIIIPSKDNPKVLSHCIHSLLENTNYPKMEVIVVDNGSDEKNKERILLMQNQLKDDFTFTYYYEKMPFNFAKMCNLGAQKANGDYILFLNDDIEVVQPDWLSIMVEKASDEKVGLVGAKLLYPDENRIQHVGITNIHLGPAHKLQFASDKELHYHRYNVSTVNVLAVTGACMLMRKEVYHAVDGFDEKLQVSFNDVEIGFHAYTLGYRNVCCNNTYLIHHESLSRGYDAGMEKVARLHRERDYLYEKYPQLWNKDPYYNSHLVKDVLDKGFEAGNRLVAFDAEKENAVLQDMTGKLDAKWHNECLYMGVEFAGSLDKWNDGTDIKEKETIQNQASQALTNQVEGNQIHSQTKSYIQGWSYAVQVDNSRYEKSILLKKIDSLELSTEQMQNAEGNIWKIASKPVRRPDMEENLPYIDHPALTGIRVCFDNESLSKGLYLIGYLWEDTCSRQKLYGFTAETIEI